jgi:hypothetical protein
MRTTLAAALAAVLAVAAPAAQSNIAKPERFTAFAVDVSNLTTRARTGTVDVAINRWSTDAERDRLLAVFHDKGQEALLSELQKLPPVGYVSSPGSLRYELRFAWQRPEADGGRMVVLMTDRYIGGWEAMHRPRTIDYPFTLVQLELDKAGSGKGKASIFTRITETKDGTIELENFANEPVMLNQVRKVQ